jgi:hypothetical protein
MVGILNSGHLGGYHKHQLPNKRLHVCIIQSILGRRVVVRVQKSGISNMGSWI